MICAFSPYAEKCQCCCRYFGAYWTFWLQMVQMFHLILLFVFIIATCKYLQDKEEADLKKAATMTIVAFVFNILHNVVTIIMSRYRDDVASDVLNLKSLLCCYECCPNWGWIWDCILGVFNCYCIVNCFDFYIYQYHILLILGLAQFVLAIITTAVALNAAKLVFRTEKKDFADTFSMIVFAFAILLLIFAILNFIFNLICMIKYIVNKCKGMSFKKREDSEKEDQQSDKDEKPDQNANEHEITEPNQNQEDNTNPVAIENHNENDDKDQKDDPGDKV